MSNMKCYTPHELGQMEKFYRANFVNSLSGVKSANLVGTKGTNEVENLAIVSSVFHVGANPPLMGVLMRPHTVPRDSLHNMKETGIFTLNHVNSTMVQAAHQTSARYPEDVSEFAETGLTPFYSEEFAAPYVQESHLRIGLEVQDIQTLDINQTELVIGQIVEVFVDEKIVSETGYLDIEAIDSIGVTGLDSYHKIRRIAQFGYAKVSNT